MTDLMIDLETLGTAQDCVVLSIGGCFFDIPTQQLGLRFYGALQIQDQLNAKRTVTEDTIKWWMKQSPEARQVFETEGLPVIKALTEISAVIKKECPDKRKLKVWGNGSTFDISILENLFALCKLELPWNYSGVQDLRTFRRFVGGGDRIKPLGTKHNAADDAVSQAAYVLEKCKPVEIRPAPLNPEEIKELEIIKKEDEAQPTESIETPTT